MQHTDELVTATCAWLYPVKLFLILRILGNPKPVESGVITFTINEDCIVHVTERARLGFHDSDFLPNDFVLKMACDFISTPLR